jgi:hypothetical protein
MGSWRSILGSMTVIQHDAGQMHHMMRVSAMRASV